MAGFRYYNLNPDGKRENDCVTRAICLATNTPYKLVRRLLTLSANELNCERLCICCYKHLLEQYFNLNTIEDGYHTVEEIADMYPYNIVLIRIEGHITCSINDCIYDIWDCRDEICTHYWII